jgi:hyaluronan synthase
MEPPSQRSALVDLEIPAAKSKPTGIDVLWKGLISLALTLVLWSSFRPGARPIHFDFFEPLRHVTLMGLCGLFAGSVGMFYAFATLFYAFRYKPVAAPDDHRLPTCTVVIPAYNEGAMVRVSLLSALANDYPAHKLEVIAVDDGSTDDTWLHIESVAKAFPTRVTAVRQVRNGGKREALREGFLRAKGDIIVTVDSDSKLAPDALRQIVAPFVADEEVGVVAGKVLVLNRYESMLTRLLAARFFITFDFTRAVQSRFGAVLCCPGALSAYRREGVTKVLDAWSSQTFLGSPCTIGEDRALTTWLLRSGYRSVYQASGVVHTIVPSTMRGIAKMLLRWERGNVRENIVLLPVFLTNWRKKDRWWPTFEVIFELVQYPLAYAMAFAALGRVLDNPIETLRISSVTCGTVWLLQSLCCLRSERSTDFVYNIGYAFLALVGLQWVFPYSCVTLKDGRWLTR